MFNYTSHPKRSQYTEGKAEGVPFFSTWCCLGGKGSHTTQCPSRRPARASQSKSPGVQRLGGTRAARNEPLGEGRILSNRDQEAAVQSHQALPRRRVQTRKSAPGLQRRLSPAPGGGAGRGRGGLKAGPGQGLAARCLMGIVVLGTGQAPSACTGNYISRWGNGSIRPRVTQASRCRQPGPEP